MRKVWIGTVILCIFLEDKCTGDLQQDKACTAVKAMGYTSPGSPAMTQLGWLNQYECCSQKQQQQHGWSTMAL